MLASSPPPLPTGEISPPSPPAPTGEWSPALAAAAAPRARARRHPYLFARVAAPRFPHRRPSPKSPSIATSQHPPPGRQLATSLPPPLRASPGPIPGPESRSWAPMPWVRPPRATPWVRCTKRVTHGARDSADEDHPAKGSPLRTSSTPPRFSILVYHIHGVDRRHSHHRQSERDRFYTDSPTKVGGPNGTQQLRWPESAGGELFTMGVVRATRFC
ncbi:uncharacterized protein N7506_012350 [Penicillium brevicompactum]|uniref:uncharacterized protein n=1 Tax=Penicillium brevicompactum TaxID=5074 RepID=UPI002541F464|nr:uncharacterized protein N7506_012350 [Penicillium brevicompactum]KAJ5319646.1 hypothetical protein N7506_012350 [Penicillium brevicompactum]